MDVDEYWRIRELVTVAGFQGDIDWSEGVKPPASALDFFREYAYVVCNSGMRYTVAKVIYRRVLLALNSGARPGSGIGHPAKSRAIDHVYDHREELFAAYREAEDKIAFLRTLPHIGPVIVYHLAKNFGVDCAKPDRHLVRIASWSGETPEGLCRRLAAATGDRVATVDLVLWRAAEQGILITKGAAV
jgi:hypothetical protein